MTKFHPDDNLDSAYKWSLELTAPNKLPNSLKELDKITDLVNKTDGILCALYAVYNSGNEEAKKYYLSMVSAFTKNLIPDIADEKQRASITFKVWFGCLYAAKMIDVVRNITPEERKDVFEKYILPLANKDDFVKFGVEIAKSFMESRSQQYSLDGIPDDLKMRIV